MLRAILLVSLCLPLAGIIPALATGPSGSIAGTITTMMGSPIPQACADVYLNEWEPAIANAVSGEDGGYSVTGLSDGDYLVLFGDCGANLYISEWFDNARDFEIATRVSVAGGGATTGIDAQLARPSSISGQLVDTQGQPVAGVCIDVIDTSRFDRTGGEPSVGVTDTEGRFLVGGLRTSDYKVSFFGMHCESDIYVDDWYNGKSTSATADLIHIDEEQDIDGIDGTLTVGGFIEGNVYNQRTGGPADRACVEVSASPPFERGWAVSITDGSGHYRIQGLRPNTYKVHFTDCSYPRRYVDEWFDDKRDQSSADAIAVQSGETARADASLTAGEINGNVRADDGLPLNRQICLWARDPQSGSRIRSTTADQAGEFMLGALLDGDYKIEIRDCNYSSPAFESEYYMDQPNFASASTVTVINGVAPYIQVSIRRLPGPDVTPPETTIMWGPDRPVNRAYFGLTASEEATFSCAIDDGIFESCSSMPSFSGLSEGPHEFRAFATDRAGNDDPTPAVWPFEVDTTPPRISITSGPAAYTSETSSAFTFTSTEPSFFTCIVDGAAYYSCDSPFTVSGLSPGAHDFFLRALDQALNYDQDNAGWHWVVDTTAPITSIGANSSLAALSSSGLLQEPYAIGSIRIDGQASDAESPLSSVAFAVDGLQVDPSEVFYESATDSWWFEFTPTATKDYSITFSANNMATLSSAATVVVHGIGPGL